MMPAFRGFRSKNSTASADSDSDKKSDAPLTPTKFSAAFSTMKDKGGKKFNEAKEKGGKKLNEAKEKGGKRFNKAKEMGGEKFNKAAAVAVVTSNNAKSKGIMGMKLGKTTAEATTTTTTTGMENTTEHSSNDNFVDKSVSDLGSEDESMDFMDSKSNFISSDDDEDDDDFFAEEEGEGDHENYDDNDDDNNNEHPIADRRGNWHKNNNTAMGMRFVHSSSSSSSLSSDKSERDAFFIQGGARNSIAINTKSNAFAIPSEPSMPRRSAVTLEADMSLKYSKATGFSTKWFKAYVILDMHTEGGPSGTLKVYADKPKQASPAALEFGPLHPTSSTAATRRAKLKMNKHHQQSTRIGSTDLDYLDAQLVKPLLEIPATMNWVAKDYENSSRRFVIEIPSESAATIRSSVLYAKMNNNKVNTSLESEMYSVGTTTTASSSGSLSEDASSTVEDVLEDKDVNGERNGTTVTTTIPTTPSNDAATTTTTTTTTTNNNNNSTNDSSLLGALATARRKKEPFRLHFQCLRKGGNEKQVWMTAFEEMGRLSFNLHKRVFGFGKKWKDGKHCKHERIREKSDNKFAKQKQILSTLGQSDLEGIDLEESSSGHPDGGAAATARGGGSSGIFWDDKSRKSTDDDSDSSLEFSVAAPKLKANFRLTHKSDRREFLVQPTYAYPNKWLTHSEIQNEMLKPSLVFHDLRLKTETRKEIGTVRVEILECSGLPSLDWNSETDAVVYLVCGSYAFTSDVILNKLNPVWLPRSRRACIFPLFHAYAKVFAGVFDDDGPGKHDDFAGRVVLDLAKCRPGSTYDVALPLRQSSHVYSKRARGAIRLRFSIDYPSHQAAILSYLPQRRLINDPDKDNFVSVLCYDETSFRNITLTVHGVDMPGRFTNPIMKATTREIDFLRKVVVSSLQEQVFDIIFYKNRTFSGLCFLAWMHCCYLNSFGLVPFYSSCFFLMLMMRNYAFYGSNGRANQGFVPPSFEEMAMALARDNKIEPLHVRPHRDEASALRSETTVKTHDEKAKKVLNVLGFKSATEEDQPEDYHMEFPMSRGLRHPITDEYVYPKLSIESCKVKKKSAQRSNTEEEDEYSEIIAAVSSSQRGEDAGDLTTRLGAAANTLQTKLGDTLERGRGRLEKAGKEQFEKGKERLKETTAMLEMAKFGNPNLLLTTQNEKNEKMDANTELASTFNRLPKDRQIQDQDIDVPEISMKGEKKKIIEELYVVRNEFHAISKFAFLDMTHVLAQEDPIYFGGKHSRHVGSDLDKLLGTGTFVSSNPVKSMMAIHMSPLISAIQAFICFTRTGINITTWHDPILSFWVTAGLIATALVSLIFPFRLFFMVVGIMLLGPQNWFIITYIKPHLWDEIQDRKQAKRLKDMAAKKKKVYRELPTNQPIVTSHTSDNSPPLDLTMDKVDKRGIHQVCVPYSQLTYRRDNYWPPQPEYGRCDPHVRGFEQSMERMEQLSIRSNTIGVPFQRRNVSNKLPGSTPNKPLQPKRGKVPIMPPDLTSISES